MATKTITIEEDVYEILKGMKQGTRESFSQVLRRELKPRKRGITGAELLELAKRPGGLLGINEEGLQEIEAMRAEMNAHVR